MLADGTSSALLRRDGEVDWWCAPRFDSEPLLWSLLDPSGSCSRWVDVRFGAAENVPAGPALSSQLVCATGRLECLDGFVDDALVRLVRALDAPLSLTHELGVVGMQGGSGLRLRGDGVGTEEKRLLTAPRGQWRCVVIGLGELPDGSPEELRDQLLEARRTADEGIDSAVVPRVHPVRAREALRVLEACAAPSGAVVAALTTSIPEAVPGDRQWDYRYCWLRDAALATSAASLLGAGTAARLFLDFAVEFLGDDPLAAPPVVAVDGGEVPSETVVPGIAGWASQQPVRVGNGARTQVQHDALGLFVEAVAVHAETGGTVSRRTRSVVRAVADGLADCVLDGRVSPSAGIWELREDRLLVSEDIGRWLALDRARGFGRSRRWSRARALLEERVLAAVREDGSLPLAYDDPDGQTDASALMVPLFGMLRGDAAKGLVRGTLDRLGSGPFVHRYEPTLDDGDAWDGFRGREGAFLPVSFMAVGALAAVGLQSEAHERLDAMLAVLPPLLPEMWDPVEDRGLGNVPLVWSHMELARALHLLDLADRRSSYGAVGYAAWRAWHGVRLKRSRRGMTRP